MSLSPSFTFGMLLATLYGAVAHLILGGGGRQLLIFLAAAWLGFAIGQAVGDVMEIHALAIGPTNVLAASLGSFIALATTAILASRNLDSR